MRKVTVHILLAAMLLSAVITQGLAATDEPASSVTVTSPVGSIDTLPPEPDTSTGAKTGAAGKSSPEAASNPLETKAPAKASTAKPGAGGSGSKSADAQPSEFWGKYFGAKFGIINSSASGTTAAPSATTLAYGVQGGYLQSGYNWDVRAVVVGVGAYADWNNYTMHSNNIAYASRAYGLDAKLGLPVDEWLPYVKLGYGYSTGTRDANLRTVAQNNSNVAVGVEYNVASRWSLIAEYKRNRFSNRDKSITINNRLFTFGFNYYFDKPADYEKEKAAPGPELAIPEPILDPGAAPEAPPAP